VPVYRGELVITKREDKKDICPTSVIHDEKFDKTRVQDQDIKKPRVVINYLSMMGGVDMSGA
jgi:hypothetical protein